MISTGNDIVSLSAINITRTNLYKFYSKILSAAENPLYNEFSLAGIPFEIFVWLLWSIKESAYKFLQRNNPELVFTPVKFVVKKLQLPEGYTIRSFNREKIEERSFHNLCIKANINFAGNILYSRSIIYQEFIYSVVNSDDDFSNTYWGVKLIDNPEQDNQSKEARAFLIERLRQLFKANDFTITKTPHGCPVLLNKNRELKIPISLSHHEKFIAYSFSTENIPGEAC